MGAAPGALKVAVSVPCTPNGLAMPRCNVPPCTRLINAASLTELFAPDLMSRRIKAFEQHYPWIASEGLDYFRSRVTQGRNDATEGLALLPASPRTPEVTERLVGAVEFKCDILWSILDAIAAASGDAGSRSAGHHG